MCHSQLQQTDRSSPEPDDSPLCSRTAHLMRPRMLAECPCPPQRPKPTPGWRGRPPPAPWPPCSCCGSARAAVWLTLSSSCQLSAMPRPLCGPGVQRNSWFRFFFFGRPGRRFARAAMSAWPGPVSLITYIMPSGATSLGIVAGGFGLDAQRRDAASAWTRGGRYGFGLGRAANVTASVWTDTN